jgi:hypothetical protein
MYYTGIHLDGLRKTMKTLNQDSRPPGNSRIRSRSVHHSTTTLGSHVGICEHDLFQRDTPVRNYCKAGEMTNLFNVQQWLSAFIRLLITKTIHIIRRWFKFDPECPLFLSWLGARDANVTKIFHCFSFGCERVLNFQASWMRNVYTCWRKYLGKHI